MNNFTVAADGMVKTTVVNPRVTLAPGTNSVFAGGGTALVIHAIGLGIGSSVGVGGSC